LHKLGARTGHWYSESAVNNLKSVATALKQHRPLVMESTERRAAVALLLREQGETLEILVIKRAEKAGDPWSGHMALPGGGWEPEDKDVYDTARRETLEEIGVDLDEGRLLGRLDDMGPRSAGRELVVSTVVVALDAEPRWLQKQEVAEAFWVPVGRLVDERVEIPDFPGEWPAFTYEDRYIIWGLTHRILTQLWALIPT
jgi:8-oxo-dGTP pyrophosphatase MutT (NUDIX family)